MRQFLAELDHDGDDGFTVLRLTDENGNDGTWLVDRSRLFADRAELEAALAAELDAAVTVEEA
ncbi:hypothetical protein STAQ_42910 [Allostella sp. ATCC 35155]|nr:hypothetical protein STAQ_42910 [Stella sp. ATCC 35155]